jgi:hypothetical protein
MSPSPDLPANQSPSPPIPPRKPQGLGWESFVERRIREAQAAGAFDNLPGRGQPIPGIDDPPDENWWIRQKLHDEGVNVLPPVLEARLDRERTLERLDAIQTEAEVRQVLKALNDRLQAAIQSAAAGPSLSVPLVDIDATVRQWRDRRRINTSGT